LRRTGALQFFAAQAMEDCGSSHYRGRELSRIGHEVRLIPPAYVKPFVSDRKTLQRTQKRSARHRSGRRCALCRSKAKRPKLLSGRDLPVRQRTQIINALHGHLSEFGLVVASRCGLATLRRTGNQQIRD
jgi:transposase